MGPGHAGDDGRDAFEREVRAALRRRAGQTDRAPGTGGLRVPIDGAVAGAPHRQRMAAVALVIVVAVLITMVVGLVL